MKEIHANVVALHAAIDSVQEVVHLVLSRNKRKLETVLSVKAVALREGLALKKGLQKLDEVEIM